MSSRGVLSLLWMVGGISVSYMCLNLFTPKTEQTDPELRKRMSETERYENEVVRKLREEVREKIKAEKAAASSKSNE